MIAQRVTECRRTSPEPEVGDSLLKAGPLFARPTPMLCWHRTNVRSKQGPLEALMGEIHQDCRIATGLGRAADGQKGGLDYLGAVKDQQGMAVEHGTGDCAATSSGPLLILAGAGSGKTNTLAYRVAHLAFRGADPQRMLLATFSRRAAAAIERRAGQLLNGILGAASSRPPHAFPWSGTFHSIGARLLREYAPRVGLHASFSIHDRTDSEDLIAIVGDDP